MPFRSPDPAAPATVHVLDDDADLGAAVARMLTRQGFVAKAFADPAALLAAYPGQAAHAVVTDVMMGEWHGFDFAERLRALDAHVAILFMTAWPSTAHAVDSVRRHGGVDYLDKPIDEARLCASLRDGVAWSTGSRASARRLGDLSPRERQVFDLMVQGHGNKAMAGLLGLSPKTIEDHRAAVFLKTQTQSVAQLIALSR
ncbi:response regulator receiver protein [Sphingomonas yabuuchiae]|uniref:Response regulator receiver protein n=1 Tax=Sphingomonas yabuuchiae TaxID=172044 RepID=A0A147IWB4_9SPHN|nr:response regulator [Sphingomonas yabuuchiae]KTT99751.1 response regulator receiver protein [Sphingomonas yabuuchiae]